jgi:hypothetical protein
LFLDAEMEAETEQQHPQANKLQTALDCKKTQLCKLFNNAKTLKVEFDSRPLGRVTTSAPRNDLVNLLVPARKSGNKLSPKQGYPTTMPTPCQHHTTTIQNHVKIML